MPGFALRIVYTQETKLKEKLSAPHPQKAKVGLLGMEASDELLKKYGRVGVLIGGLAKEIWRGNTEDKKLSSHKDVDIFVLGNGDFPEEWEDGIDWWLSSEFNLPQNGHVELVWELELSGVLSPGLYLPPAEVLKEIVLFEREYFPENKVEGFRKTKTKPTILPIAKKLRLV